MNLFGKTVTKEGVKSLKRAFWPKTLELGRAIMCDLLNVKRKVKCELRV